MNARLMLVGTAGIAAMTMLAGLGLQPKKEDKKPATPPAAKPDQPAQPPAADPMMEALAAAAKPGEFHKHLDALVGMWDAKVTMTMAPGAPPMESTGTMRTEWILGDRYLKSMYSGSMMGEEFEGVATFAYNNITKRYESTWIDSMSTGISYSSGQCDASGKVITMTGEYDDAMTGTKKKMKTVTTIVNENTNNEQFYDVGADGKETKTMEINYTRTAKPIKAKS